MTWLFPGVSLNFSYLKLMYVSRFLVVISSSYHFCELTNQRLLASNIFPCITAGRWILFLFLIFFQESKQALYLCQYSLSLHSRKLSTMPQSNWTLAVLRRSPVWQVSKCSLPLNNPHVLCETGVHAAIVDLM